MEKEMIAVMSRCYKTKKLFGIRFDKNKGNEWEAAWAFPLKEGADKREKGYTVSIKGSFILGNNYPGCPYCGNPSYFMCKCGKLSCWNCENTHVICPHCGKEIDLNAPIIEIRGDGDF